MATNPREPEATSTVMACGATHFVQYEKKAEGTKQGNYESVLIVSHGAHT